MARLCYFKFKTRQDNTCRVDIYDATYTGTAQYLDADTAGSYACPADSPLVIEEDASEDLLEVIRVKTGYIRLRELVAGALTSRYPQTNDELEVYAWMDAPDNMTPETSGAGDYIIFHGYVQAQTFQDNYIDYRREVCLPIQSMLGLMDEEPIGESPVDSEPRFGDPTVIKDIFYRAFQEYDYIYLPYLTYGDTYTPPGEDKNIMLMKLLDVALYPYNEDYNFGMVVDGVEPDVYTPLTKREFLERFCHAFGLIAHDVGRSLVFTKVGFNGEYYKYDVSLLNYALTWEGVMTFFGYGNDIIYLSSFNYANDQNTISNVSPLAKVTEKWEPWPTPIVLDLTIGKYIGYNSQDQFAVLQYKGHNIKSSYWSQSTAQTVSNRLRLCGDGDNEFLYLNNMGDLNNALFSVIFQSPSDIVLSGRLMIETDNLAGHGLLGISVKSGGEWWQFDNSETGIWSDTEWIEPLTFDNDHICEISILAQNQEVEVFFYHQTSGSGITTKIKKIELGWRSNGFKYQNRGKNDHRTVNLDETAKETSEIDANFCLYAFGGFNRQTYRYLGLAQRNLSLSLFRNANISEAALLTGRFGLSNTDTYNRIISSKYDVRKDEMILQIMGNQYIGDENS